MPLKRAGSASDPLWYKDAVIYELHVKAFVDSNGDGIGDLRGLIDRLDYIQDLGVTCLWLLPFFPSPLRDDGYDISDYLNIHPDYGTMEDFQALVDAVHERGLQVMIELVVNHTSDQHAWFQAARHAPPGSPERDFYVWSDSDQQIRGRAHHLHRHGEIQLDVGPGREGVLLAPLLLAPARPELRQPGGRRRSAEGDALLAGPRRGRPAAGRDPVPHRARRHELREPARDARAHQADPRGNGRRLRQPRHPRGSEPVAERRAAVLRRRRRMPHGVPLSADAAHLHGAAPRGPPADHRHHGPDAGHPALVPVGALPAQPRRADAGDGQRRRARLHVSRVQRRPAHAPEHRHPPPPRAADGQQPPAHRAPEQPALLVPRHADPVLRRRDRHGRQHLPGRSQRRAHADAVERGPQRRLLAGQPAAALQPRRDGSGVRLRGGQRRGAAGRFQLAAALDAQHDRAPQAVPRLRPRIARVPAPVEPQGARVSAALRRRARAVRRESLALRAAGRTGPVRVRRHAPRGNARLRRVPRHRQAAVRADARPVRVHVVRAAGTARTDRGRRGRRPAARGRGMGGAARRLEPRAPRIDRAAAVSPDPAMVRREGAADPPHVDRRLGPARRRRPPHRRGAVRERRSRHLRPAARDPLRRRFADPRLGRARARVGARLQRRHVRRDVRRRLVRPVPGGDRRRPPRARPSAGRSSDRRAPGWPRRAGRSISRWPPSARPSNRATRRSSTAIG